MSNNTQNLQADDFPNEDNTDLPIPSNVVHHLINCIFSKIEKLQNKGVGFYDRAKRRDYIHFIAPFIVEYLNVKDPSFTGLLGQDVDSKKITIGEHMRRAYKDERLNLRKKLYKLVYLGFLDCKSLDDFHKNYPLNKEFQKSEDDTSSAKKANKIELPFGLTYFIGFYYSVKEYSVKKFGLAIDFNNLGNSPSPNIFEWGFHENSNFYYKEFKSELLKKEPLAEEIEVKENKEIDELFSTNLKPLFVSEPKFKGKATMVENILYGVLEDGEKQMNLICSFENNNHPQGTLQTIVDVSGKHPISVEIFLIKAPENNALPLNITDLYERIDGYNTDEIKDIVLYLMSKRNNYLIWPKSATLASLATKNTPISDIRNNIVGTYRVWNLDDNDDVVQSRIIIDDKFRCFLIPYFEEPNSIDLQLKVQCCTININSTKNGRVWIPSFKGLKVTNIAIIDFLNPFNGVLKGVFGSVGTGSSVVGDYMALIKDERAFQVKKIGNIKKARIYATEFKVQKLLNTLLEFLRSRQGRNLNGKH